MGVMRAGRLQDRQPREAMGAPSQGMLSSAGGALSAGRAVGAPLSAGTGTDSLNGPFQLEHSPMTEHFP